MWPLLEAFYTLSVTLYLHRLQLAGAIMFSQCGCVAAAFLLSLIDFHIVNE